MPFAHTINCPNVKPATSELKEQSLKKEKEIIKPHLLHQQETMNSFSPPPPPGPFCCWHCPGVQAGVSENPTAPAQPGKGGGRLVAGRDPHP